MRRFSLLLLGLLLPTTTSALRADVLLVDVTPNNIDKQPLHFEVAAVKRKTRVHFTFTVAKTAKLPRCHDAGIDIRSGMDQVVECRLKPYRAEQSISYEFTVSQRHLTNSRFSLFNIGGNAEDSIPSGTIFQFQLSEFHLAKEKGAGQVQEPKDGAVQNEALQARALAIQSPGNQGKKTRWNRISKIPQHVVRAAKRAALSPAAADPWIYEGVSPEVYRNDQDRYRIVWFKKDRLRNTYIFDWYEVTADACVTHGASSSIPSRLEKADVRLLPGW